MTEESPRRMLWKHVILDRCFICLEPTKDHELLCLYHEQIEKDQFDDGPFTIELEQTA